MPRVMIVESDSAYAGELTRELSQRLGRRFRTPPLEFTLAHDGQAALDAASRQPPDLLVVCVELPTISGYSVCNKAKKHPLLKHIPLIIMSAEATPEAFEQHSKLRTPADAYLIKPFPVAALAERVAALLGPGDDGTQLESAIDTSIEQGFSSDDAAPLGTAAAPAEPDLELEIDDGDLLADEPALAASPLAAPAASGADQEIALATDAAFAALELPDEGGVSSPAPSWPLPALNRATAPAAQWQRTPAVTPLAADPPTEPEDTLELASEPALVPGGQQPVDATDDLLLAPNEPLPALAPEPAESDGFPESLEIDESPAGAYRAAPSAAETVVRSGLAPLAAVALDADDSRAAAAERRVIDLQQENDRLTQALREANTAKPSAASGLTRDRELLGLREVINKKEREILDLRDELDARERQILDHKDKVRELDRRARDMDEKLLGVEKELVTARERAEALQQDKQRLVERESGVKQRLEEAKREIEKSYAENAQAKERHDRDLARLKEQQGEALHQAEQRLAEVQTKLRDEHAAELRELTEEYRREQQVETSAHLKELERSEQAHRDELAQLEARHQREQQALREQQQQQLEQATQQQREQLETQRAEAQLELAQAEARARETLEAQRAQQQEQLEQATQQQRAQLAQTRASHEEALQRVKQQNQDLLEQIETEHAEEKESLRAAHQAECAQLREGHAAALAALAQQHELALDTLRQQHAAQRQQRDEEQQAQTAALERTIAGQQEQLIALGALLDSHELRLAEALAKLQRDAELGEKARRALAVAVVLLDQQESIASGSGAAAPEAATP